MSEVFFFWDPTIVLLIPALMLALWAQMRVQSAYSRFSRVPASSGLSAYEAARILLDRNGLLDVDIEVVPGTLSDHYDPRGRVLRLSEGTYRSRSIAALGIAAHEVGHAVQHATGYAALAIRNAIVPVVNFGSMLAFPLFLFGLLFRSPGLMDLGILLFLGVVLFHLITLPVEFDASSRAVRMLLDGGLINVAEVGAVRSVLSAAALTYVAATAMAVANLLRLLMFRSMARDE